MRHTATAWTLCTAALAGAAGLPAPAAGQEQSVRPGINDTFRDPDVTEFVERFEGESREVFTHRQRILEACGVRPGMRIADVGAGTGLFTRLFANAVGPGGRVLAVDISQKFLDHIDETARASARNNVETVLASDDATNLPPESVDLAFICDTYHHFEYPQRTLRSIHRALRPGGRVIVVDFIRIPGQSSDWVLGHVRAGQDVVEQEIEQCGFKRTEARLADVLTENYFVEFVKVGPRRESNNGAAARN